MRRCDAMKPFIVMDIVREADKIPDCIHFEIGQPDLPPAPGVLKALQNFSGSVPYTESLGLRELRRKIAGHYYESYRLEVDPNRIALTQGTSGAFLLAYALTLDARETLALADPGYPCYRNLARMLDIEPSAINVDASTGYQITPEMLEGRDIRTLYITSPGNPTGTRYSDENLEVLCRYCEEKRDIPDLRRALPRPDLRRGGAERVGLQRRCHRDQRLFPSTSASPVSAWGGSFCPKR